MNSNEQVSYSPQLHHSTQQDTEFVAYIQNLPGSCPYFESVFCVVSQAESIRPFDTPRLWLESPTSTWGMMCAIHLQAVLLELVPGEQAAVGCTIP